MCDFTSGYYQESENNCAKCDGLVNAINNPSTCDKVRISYDGLPNSNPIMNGNNLVSCGCDS